MSSVGISSSGLAPAIAGTTRCRNASSISMRLFAYGFGNTWWSSATVASLPASSRAKTWIGVFEVLVVEQREEGDAQRRVRW